MSREELVEAYVDGKVSRRIFIRGLVALGVTSVAAVAYADALSADPVRPAQTASDLYGDLYGDGTTTTTDPNGAVGAGGAGRAPAAAAVAARPTFTG